MRDDALLDELEALPPSCFVICPIGDQDAEIGSPSREVFELSTEVFEEIILPAAKPLDSNQFEQINYPEREKFRSKSAGDYAMMML